MLTIRHNLISFFLKRMWKYPLTLSFNHPAFLQPALPLPQTQQSRELGSQLAAAQRELTRAQVSELNMWAWVGGFLN